VHAGCGLHLLLADEQHPRLLRLQREFQVGPQGQADALTPRDTRQPLTARSRAAFFAPAVTLRCRGRNRRRPLTRPGPRVMLGLSVCPIRGLFSVEWGMRTQRYPSDLTDEQWALIEPLIPVYPGGRPRTTSMRDVLDAIFYLVRTGCQWRFLP